MPDKTPCPHGMPSKASCVDCMYDEGLGAEPTPPVTIESVFTARFDGECPVCDRPIIEGVDRIAKMSNGRYVHYERCT